MSQIPENNDNSGDDTNNSDQPKKRSLTIFDAMLVLALLFITLATFRMFVILREYSANWPFSDGSPWSVGG